MGLETGTYISDLNASNPASGDAKSQGDDHFRLLKSTLQATFPNITGAVTKTHTEINALAPLASPVFTGVVAVPLGAAALPSYTFSGDLNTGMWSPAADTIAWSTAGAEQMRLASNSLRLGATSSALDGITLNTSLNIGWDEGSNSAIATSFRQTSSAGHIIGSGVKWSANADAFASSRTSSWGHSAIKVGYEVISFYVNAAASVAVGTDVTMVERMRITSAGNVGIGDNPASNTRLLVSGGTSDNTAWAMYAENLANAQLFSVRNDGATFTGLAASSPYYLTTATAANMVVQADGYLYRSTSSIKYKEQVRNYTRGIDAVLALRPVFYKSKGSGDVARATEKELAKLPKQYDADGKEIKQKLPKDFVLPAGPDYAGFIAEEVHAIAPEFVQYADDGTPDALSYGHITALLCKAIQEQQALIVALTARVAKLEK